MMVVVVVCHSCWTTTPAPVIMMGLVEVRVKMRREKCLWVDSTRTSQCRRHSLVPTIRTMLMAVTDGCSMRWSGEIGWGTRCFVTLQ